MSKIDNGTLALSILGENVLVVVIMKTSLQTQLLHQDNRIMICVLL